MNVPESGQPLVLVDDDAASSRHTLRMLHAHDAPAIACMTDADAAIARLGAIAAAGGAVELVIVDLKSAPTASRDFIARLRALPHGSRLLVAAMAPSLERVVRDDLLLAGADAVFQRAADLVSDHGEAAAIVRFWERNRTLEAVST